MSETSKTGTGRHLAPERALPEAEPPRRRRQLPEQEAEPAPEFRSRRDRRLESDPEPEFQGRRTRRSEAEPAPELKSRRARRPEAEPEPELKSRRTRRPASEPAPELKGRRTRRSEPEPEAEPKRNRPRRRRKPMSLFRTGLLIYAGLMVAGSLFLQGTLWGYLKNSQAEMDRLAAEDAALHARDNAVAQAPQRAFEAWMDNLSVDYWMGLLSEKTDTALDGEARLRDYVTEHFASDAVQAYKAGEYTKEAPVYVLKNAEETLARVAVTGQELKWTVSDVELPLLEEPYSVNITVPAGCTVTCNGVQLDEESLQPSEGLLNYEPLEGDLKKPVSWRTYSQDGFLLEPVITVQPPKGFGLLQTEDGGYLLTTDDDMSEYEENSVKFVRTYLNYVMNNNNATYANMNTVLGYLKSDTRAHETIKESYDAINWATYYQNIDTSATEAVAVIYWAKNCFSVDVAYDANATLQGKPVDYADATMRIFYLLTDDGYIISDFTTL